MISGLHTCSSQLRSVFFWLTAIVSMVATPELAEASRLDKISGGVSNSYETMRQLKMVSLYGGCFFLASSAGLFFGRKKLNLTYLTPLLIFLLGAALALFSYA